MKIKFSYFLLIFITNYIFCQENDENLDDFFNVNSIVKVPNSPEAEAFIQYGNIPISYYTGKPNISIPIYNIKGREFSVPILVSYELSAIKVQSISTSVGAGWTLQAGGVVSRKVNDLPDDLTSGGPEYKINNPDIIEFNAYISSLRSLENGLYADFEDYDHELTRIQSYINIRNDHAIGEVDLMPDVYNFSAPGLSGTIVIDYQTGKAVSIKDSDIEVNYITSASGSITNWIITNAKGDVYYFNVPEETTVTFSSGGNEGTRVYNSSWYLSKIESANKKDIFKFKYTPSKYWDQPQVYYNQQMARNVLSDCGKTPDYDPTINTFITTSSLNDLRIKQPTLLSIDLNGKSRMMFYHNENRLDLTGRKKLDQIEVRYDTKLLKTFSFHHSYFSSDALNKTEEDYRLKLDSITIEGGNITTQQPLNETSHIQTYSFNYRGDNKLPSRKSLAIDYLGYYNGNNGSANTTLIPKYIDEYGRVFSGANREPHFNSKTKGMLKEIYYPIGGSTSFEIDHFIVDNVNESKTFWQSLGGVGSGSDPAAQESDYDCDDGFWYYPKTITTDFTVANGEIITDETAYFFNSTSTGNYSQTGRIFFMAIYKSTSASNTGPSYTQLPNGCIEPHGFNTQVILCPGECKDVPVQVGSQTHSFRVCYENYVGNNHSDNSKTFCEIKEMIENNDSDIVYYTYGVPTSSSKLIFPGGGHFLPSGSYKVFIANSLLGISASLNRRYFKNIEQNIWSNSPRISKIVDKTNEGEQYIKTLDYLTHNIQQHIQLHDVKRTQGNIDPDCYETSSGHYDTLERQTNNIYGSTLNEITYPKVRETVEDAAGNMLGSTLYEYYDQKFYTNNSGLPGIPSSYNPRLGEPYVETNPVLGQLKRTSQYDKTGRLLKSNEHIYEFEKSVVITGGSFYGGITWQDICTIVVPGELNPSLNKLAYTTSTNSAHKACISSGDNIVINGWRTRQGNGDNNIRFYKFDTKLNETLTKDYYYGATGKVDSLIQNVTYNYGVNHNLPIHVRTTLSNDEARTLKTQYPLDIQNPTIAEQALINKLHKATPINIKSYVNKGSDEKLISTKYTVYNTWGDGFVLPQLVQTLKGKPATDNVLENQVQFHKYDVFGNPLEVSQISGMHVIYVWGYNNEYLIAKINNATYEGMPEEITNLINEIKEISNGEDSNINEATLISMFEQLRDHSYFKNSEINSYTYIPPVGITSMTTPKGYTTFYEYDEFNRLQYIKDDNHKIIEEYKYDYKK
ncbi:hypothetical protein [Abyssalbus ytuae]|uniref:YD repeat-containing protein n=1 Tax=Abyssalbus ytuae TaxID=2926907 RepID=A0A9E7CTY7_9FLAO|nr:hypothetical protein [Abyssalbus ytuae]UOB19001.1 hypothetical protein MQE35_06810 [Abyssalbus ytuae]